MDEGLIALGLFFVGLVLLLWAGIHVIARVTAGTPTNTQLVTGLCIAGVALLVAGGILWKRGGPYVE